MVLALAVSRCGVHHMLPSECPSYPVICELHHMWLASPHWSVQTGLNHPMLQALTATVEAMLYGSNAWPCMVWIRWAFGWLGFQVLTCLWAPRIAPHVTITLVMLETINAWEKKMGF